MYVLILASCLGADFSSWTALENRVAQNEADIVALRNDVAALKRDINTKCDVASKSPEPKPAAKCPDGVCADCKCTVGEDCGCKKTTSEKLLADVLTTKVVEHASEPEPIYLQSRPSYGNGGCVGGNCPVSRTRTRRGLFGRNR